MRHSTDWVTLMNDVLLMEASWGAQSLSDKTEYDDWNLRESYRPRRDYDQVESQLAITNFMAEHQERDDFAE